MLSFFVPGRPQPEPKRGLAQMRSGRKYIYKRDPDGSKRRWVENVRLAARKAMHEQNFKMIQEGIGVSVDYRFYFKQAPSNKHDAMVIKPDSSRLAEAIDDALEGVCYKDDCQINRRMAGDKRYTTDGEGEGAWIEVWESKI